MRTILDAIEFVLKEQGEPQSPFWLASQMEEMRLWKASAHAVRVTLEKDITMRGNNSQFLRVGDDEYDLGSKAES